MTDRITMETSEAFVEVVPQLGGSISAFDVKSRGKSLPILRRWTGESENPRGLGSSPMVPWFNRISGGGINFGGKFHPIEPNDPQEPVPLHGDGWSSPWEVIEHKRDRIELKLRSKAIPPFDYEAIQVLKLEGSTLDVGLRLKHLGTLPFPYGLGQHPWFVRTPGVRLQAHATGMWLDQPPAFPAKTEPAPIPAKWDFNEPKALPDDFIDNGYAGWDGRARIDWTDRGVAVDVEADPSTRFYHVYSLDKDCPIFCFEPVTHPNNAYGKPGTPEANGLRVLAHGAETSMRMRLKAMVS
jgi:aldose 1-epimerase